MAVDNPDKIVYMPFDISDYVKERLTRHHNIDPLLFDGKSDEYLKNALVRQDGPLIDKLYGDIQQLANVISELQRERKEAEDERDIAEVNCVIGD